ncbi:uncharacterized protein LOC109600797 isoform X2 [Aethina tumida]|uniref:uncharacterized protein LOC109600797 isoform X2 n=1 Tax=Aethina tumida TaxID=116153 RepID=UPI00214745E9|nr:uncharacterized protein LOC109600797 isoform X2 [Aethina tumida]
MTNYWWMHWFWITCCLYVFFVEVTFTAVISTTSELTPTNSSNDTQRSGKSIGRSSYIPATTVASIITTTLTTPLTTTTNKSHKPSFKKLEKFDLITNKTLKGNTSKVCDETHNMTVINQTNTTDTNIDNQILINASFNAINHTDNLTYVEDVNYNQTLGDRLNVETASLESDLSGNLSAAGITGITLGCVVVVGLICGISYFLYRNRSFNRPQVLNDRCSNPDSSGYIDDASDNSEEMYSLDNDSFLNSLEAMTIQNYWTDTVKHTKL